MNMSFDFGKWLISTRKELGLSQTQLSEKIMIDSQNISHYENGKYIPNLYTLDRICNALGYEIQIVSKEGDFFKNNKS